MPRDVCCGLPATSKLSNDPDEIELEPYSEVRLSPSLAADDRHGSRDTLKAIPYEDMEPATYIPTSQRSSFVWFSQKYNSVKQGLTGKASEEDAPSLTLPDVSNSSQAHEWAEDLVDSLSSKPSEALSDHDEHLISPTVASEPQLPPRLQELSIKASSSIYSQDVGSRPTSQDDLTTPFQPFSRSRYEQVAEYEDAITPVRPLYKDNRTPEQKVYNDLTLLTPSNFHTSEERESAPAESLYTYLQALDDCGRLSLDVPACSTLMDLPERSPARLSRHPSILDQQRWTPPETLAVKEDQSPLNSSAFPSLSRPISTYSTPGALRFIQEGRLLHEIAENDGVIQSLSRASVAIGRQQRPEINEHAIAARERADVRLRHELSDIQIRRRSTQMVETSSLSPQVLRPSLSMMLPARAQQPNDVINKSLSTQNRKSRFQENDCTLDPSEARRLSKRLFNLSFTKARNTLRRKSLSILYFMPKESQLTPAIPQFDDSADHEDTGTSCTSSDNGLKRIQRARALSDTKDAAGVMANAIQRNQEEKSALFLGDSKEEAVFLRARQRSTSFTRAHAAADLARPLEPRSQSATLFPPLEFKTPQFAFPRPRQPSESLDPGCPSPLSFVSGPTPFLPTLPPSFCQSDVEAEHFGKWGAFPQFTKADRIGLAGSRDGVWSRDFALGDNMTISPLANEKRTSFRQNKNISKIRTTIKSYWDHITSPNIEYYKHGHGHRTSVSLGGRPKRPELDLLP